MKIGKIRKRFTRTGILFIVFMIFTLVVMKLDVRPIGPEGSSVGLASLNKSIHEKIGVSGLWYDITEWLGMAAILLAVGFALLGAKQLIKRKSLFKVDKDIILLGGYFVLVIAAYIFFDKFIVNYRPIIMDAGKGLEPSYPSSHAMIITSIMAAAMIQFNHRIKNRGIKALVQIISAAVIVLVVVGRLLSGVHWFTDIIGGVILSGFFVSLYYSLYKIILD